MSLFNEIKDEFPILDQSINSKKIAYFDSTATTLTPRFVVDKISQFDLLETSNVHRGVHTLSQKATDRFENTRRTVQKYINAQSENEIIFTSGATDSMNLVANSYCGYFMNEGDEIILTQLEHHSNIVPWQILAEKNNYKIKFVPIKDNGELDFEVFKNLITKKTKILSMNHCSNTLGIVSPVKKFIEFAHSKNIHVHLDATQSVNSFKVDVQDLDCDFLSFSAHKMFGPFGVGVLYGKLDLLEKLPPYRGGGSMIDEVLETGSTFAETPQKFEAGTPNISGVIGLGSALDFINNIGLDKIHSYESQIYNYMCDELDKIESLKSLGSRESRIKILSFVFPDIHHTDMASLMDQEGVAVRSGRHCTNLIMKRFDIKGTIRASVSIYNNEQQVDQLVASIIKAKGFF